MAFAVHTCPSFSLASEDGDQINAPGRETDPRPSHEQGKENSHQNLDSKDQKSIAVSVGFSVEHPGRRMEI